MWPDLGEKTICTVFIKIYIYFLLIFLIYIYIYSSTYGAQKSRPESLKLYERIPFKLGHETVALLQGLQMRC